MMGMGFHFLALLFGVGAGNLISRFCLWNCLCFGDFFNFLSPRVLFSLWLRNICEWEELTVQHACGHYVNLASATLMAACVLCSKLPSFANMPFEMRLFLCCTGTTASTLRLRTAFYPLYCNYHIRN